MVIEYVQKVLLLERPTSHLSKVTSDQLQTNTEIIRINPPKNPKFVRVKSNLCHQLWIKYSTIQDFNTSLR